jgi:hypothetical protein
MSEKQSCASCLFFQVGTSTAFKQVDGQCRRYAPQGPVLGSESNGYQLFPPMTSWHWCGDYRPAPAAAATQRAVAA